MAVEANVGPSRTGVDLSSPSAVADLISLAGHADPLIRASVAATFCRYDDARSTPVLLGLATDEDVRVRQHALNALRTIQDPRILPVLCNLASDGDMAIRLGVSHALGRYGGPAALDTLCDHGIDWFPFMADDVHIDLTCG